MPLTCNIDAKGKFIRLMYGIVAVVIGILMLIFWTIPAGSIVSWIVTSVILAGGAFAIFEARAGWCVTRAMGFKTPF